MTMVGTFAKTSRRRFWGDVGKEKKKAWHPLGCMQPVRERGLDGHDTKKESGRRPDGRWEENDASWETVEEEGPPYLATVRLQRGVYCRSKVHGISDPRGPNDRTRLPFGTPSRSGKTQEEGKDGLTPEMRRDVIPLDASNLTSLPMTGQTQVVGALPSHVIVAKVDVEDFRVGEGILAPLPLAFDGLVCRRHGRGRSAAEAGRVVGRRRRATGRGGLIRCRRGSIGIVSR